MDLLRPGHRIERGRRTTQVYHWGSWISSSLLTKELGTASIRHGANLEGGGRDTASAIAFGKKAAQHLLDDERLTGSVQPVIAWQRGRMRPAG
jgi:hypothetical protein